MKPKPSAPASFTPGPWKAEKGYQDQWHISSPKAFPIFTVLCGTPEAEANARLISSAPDLLAAAKLFVEVHAIHCKGEKCQEFGVDLFKAAILKAEGRK